ncbi:MAG: diguanylate cyclase [Vogesella sp.]|jgi:diguanylate cyclase (GGDEF)-like protein|uniref:diguanylate cyclase n=1 Tax=Vogesella sp. TaxID=1904252 RepID=UPI0011C9F1A9
MKQQQKILIVDDVIINLHLLDGLLKADYTVLMAKNGQQALQLAREHHPDLVLLDVVMPEMDGFAVLQALRHDARTKHIPVIFITGQDRPEDEAQGLLRGAVDYITKPLNEVIVKARVATHLKLERQRRMLESLANIDGLTELPNRRQLDQVYQGEWERARRNQLPLSVAIIDVDCFKQYNDHCGHAMGDRVLQQLAQTIAANLGRPGDLAARYGGEEFVVILPATQSQGAWQLLESMRHTVESMAIPHPASPVSPVVTISAGVASLQHGADTPAALLQLADQRLYHAKRSGRNCVVGEAGIHIELGNPLYSLG